LKKGKGSNSLLKSYSFISAHGLVFIKVAADTKAASLAAAKEASKTASTEL
jgi:hypothetical protein